MSRQGFGRSLTLITLTQACGISLCFFGSLSPAIGQINGDRTLGAESSVIVPNVNIKGIPSDQIEGGAIRGTSLFHSFTEFSIREGRGAYFSNPAGIENILSRVTGTNPSNIFGRLGVLGNANLFLINPNGALVSASSFGQGDAGSVTITARDTIAFDGVGSNGFASGAFSAVGQRAVGKGGDVNVTTGSLFLTNGAQLVASTKGQGDAGSVTITARDTVAFDGEGNTGLPSGAFSTVALQALGNGGNVNITTGSLFLSHGALVSTATGGQGDAGRVTLLAHDTIAFDGEGSSGLSSGAFSFVGATAVGKGGDVNVTTGSLSLTNGAQVSAATRGQGDAGSVTITAHDTIAFDGVDDNGFSSGAFSNVGAGAVGMEVALRLTPRPLKP